MEREEVGVGRERTEEREESRHQHQVGASAISSWEGEGGSLSGHLHGNAQFLES